MKAILDIDKCGVELTINRKFGNGFMRNCIKSN